VLVVAPSGTSLACGGVLLVVAPSVTLVACGGVLLVVAPSVTSFACGGVLLVVAPSVTSGASREAEEGVSGSSCSFSSAGDAAGDVPGDERGVPRDSRFFAPVPRGGCTRVGAGFGAPVSTARLPALAVVAALEAASGLGTLRGGMMLVGLVCGFLGVS
jgi:hypothetical protein